MKVVYNACFGGFSLSEAGIQRYAELKGVTLYPEQDKKFGMLTHYWTIPPEKRRPPIDGDDWHKATQEERIAYNQFYRDNQIYDRDIERDDPLLVQVVEEMGDAANGRCAKLAIEDVPADSLWRIDEYDGNERVMTQTSYDWKVAR